MTTNVDAQTILQLNTTSQKKKKRTVKRKTVHWGTALFLIIWSAYVLVPFYIMFNLATKTRHESTYMPFSWFWEEGFTLEAFSTVFEDTGLGTTVLSGFGNTMLYTVPTVIIGLFVGSRAA